MVCSKCGTDAPEGSLFCPECGSALSAPEPAQPIVQPAAPAQPVTQPAAPAAAPSAPPAISLTEHARQRELAANAAVKEVKPEKKKNKVLPAVIIIAVCLLIAAGVTYVVRYGLPFGGKQPDEIVTEYMEAIDAEDFEACIELYPPELIEYIESKDLDPQNQLLSDLKRHPYKITSYEIQDVEDADEEETEKLSKICENEMGFSISDMKYVFVELNTSLNIITNEISRPSNYDSSDNSTYNSQPTEESSKAVAISRSSSNTHKISVVKCRGKWYLFAINYYSLSTSLLEGHVFGGYGPREIAIKYFNVISTTNYINEEMIKDALSLYPDQLLDYWDEQGIYTSKDLTEKIEDFRSKLSFFSSHSTVAMSSSVSDAEEDTIEQLSKICKKKMGFSVSDIKYVTAKWIFSDSNAESAAEDPFDGELVITVIKVDGEWYLFTLGDTDLADSFINE